MTQKNSDQSVTYCLTTQTPQACLIPPLRSLVLEPGYALGCFLLIALDFISSQLSPRSSTCFHLREKTSPNRRISNTQRVLYCSRQTWNVASCHAIRKPLSCCLLWTSAQASNNFSCYLDQEGIISSLACFRIGKALVAPERNGLSSPLCNIESIRARA